MCVVARLTAAWRLLAASRRGSTCSEWVAPAHTVKPTTTATSATDGATGIRTPGSRRTHHQHDGHDDATGHATHGDHHPSADGPPTHLTDDPQGRADGERRQEAGLTTPGWRCAR